MPRDQIEIDREWKVSLFESDRDAMKAMLVAWGSPFGFLALLVLSSLLTELF